MLFYSGLINESVKEDEDMRWKKVHGDVFRPPIVSPMLLSAFVGSGVHIFCCVVAFVVFATQELFTIENTDVVLMLSGFCASFGGYSSARLYKTTGREVEPIDAVNTVLLYHGFASVMFIMIFMVNIGFLFTTGNVISLFVLISTMLWLFVSIPFALVGSYFGFKQEAIKMPTRFKTSPRQMWFTKGPCIIILGSLPFSAVMVEMLIIMTSILEHQTYHVVGSFIVMLIALPITCEEMSIVMTHFQLNRKDYQWLWNSFLTGGSGALYMFAYSVWFYITRLNFTNCATAVNYFL